MISYRRTDGRTNNVKLLLRLKIPSTLESKKVIFLKIKLTVQQTSSGEQQQQSKPVTEFCEWIYFCKLGNLSMGSSGSFKLESVSCRWQQALHQDRAWSEKLHVPSPRDISLQSYRYPDNAIWCSHHVSRCIFHMIGNVKCICNGNLPPHIEVRMS